RRASIIDTSIVIIITIVAVVNDDDIVNSPTTHEASTFILSVMVRVMRVEGK
ncbi:unnamed protein product, partial [Hydatigera taeniaeformis]|uniref:Secreted protein n=1 Tax=Hydatigena taeniaeformis TaxID=6205 RepID=A0A0R3WYB4_HYDTA